MSTVGADPKHEKVLEEINQVTLEVAKIESRLGEMGKGSPKRSDSPEESESASKEMPKGETQEVDAGGQVASYAGTLMKNVEKGEGSRDPALQKAIDESARALIEQREKAQQEKEMGEAIFQSMIELSKKEKEKAPSQEEEAVLKAKAISLKLLQRERAKKETEEREADEEEAILRSVQDESKKLAAEELLKKQIDAALKASAEEIKLQVRKEVREEVVQEVVVPMKLRAIAKECAEAQALSKALNEEMTKVEEKRRKAKADAASLSEVMSLRLSDKGSSKSESLMGEPESGQPLVLLMLGERSCEKYDKGMAKEGNLQFASGLLDCGCSSITLIDEEVFKKWRHHYGKMVRKVRWLKTPLVVNTAGDDKPLIVAMAEVYVVMCHETGTTEAGWVECDVMRGGNTGGCTLIIGNKFMRKQCVDMRFAEESGEGGHMQSEKWGKGKVPMFWKARDLEKMGERVSKKMGVETRELKKMSFSGEIRSNVKVTSISSEQREGAKEAKIDPTPKKTGKKKVHFEKELAEYAPRSKVYMSQQAFNEDQGDETPEKGERGERKVMKLSTETMAQAAKELGQVAARCKLERLERERGKLPEEERKNASFDVESNKELPQLGKLLEEDHAKVTESWMYLTGDNKWVAVRLNLPHFKDLIDLSLASHKLSASTHTAEELKLCADQADTHLVPVIKRGRPASEVMMKDPHRVIPIREGLIGSIEERPEYLELKVSQKEKDERAEKEKEAKQKRRKHWEESKPVSYTHLTLPTTPYV